MLSWFEAAERHKRNQLNCGKVDTFETTRYFIHRLHFSFLVTFHYLFPQLTMGLAPLIVVLKTIALRTGNESYDHVARFWMKIFGINFAPGRCDRLVFGHVFPMKVFPIWRSVP